MRTVEPEHLTMKASRRPLAFASLARVMPDVDRLLEGHTTVGYWSLGQICNHLTQSLKGTTASGLLLSLLPRATRLSRSVANEHPLKARLTRVPFLFGTGFSWDNRL